MAFYASFARNDPDPEAPRNQQLRGVASLMRTGWGEETHAYRNVFTTLINPEADNVQLRVISEFLKVANEGPDAANMLESLLEVDTSPEARSLDLPVLVLHRRADQLVPFEGGGRDIAALVPGARLEVFEGSAHGLLDDEIIDSLMAFLGEDRPGR